MDVSSVMSRAIAWTGEYGWVVQVFAVVLVTLIAGAIVRRTVLHLIERTKATVTQVIDVINSCIFFSASKILDVSNCGKEIFSSKMHYIFRYIHIELTVDTEATYFAKAIPVVIKELLGKELSSLFHLWWVARAKSTVDFQEGSLVFSRVCEEIEFFDCERV